MIQMLQPLSGLLLGLALSVFGLVHSIRAFPASTVWHAVGRFLPQLAAVLAFIACALVAAVGVLLVIRGIRGARRRLRQLRRIRWEAENDPDYDAMPPGWR